MGASRSVPADFMLVCSQMESNTAWVFWILPTEVASREILPWMNGTDGVYILILSVSDTEVQTRNIRTIWQIPCMNRLLYVSVCRDSMTRDKRRLRVVACLVSYCYIHVSTMWQSVWIDIPSLMAHQNFIVYSLILVMCVCFCTCFDFIFRISDIWQNDMFIFHAWGDP